MYWEVGESDSMLAFSNIRANVFQKNKSTISRHIKNIFATNELERDQVVANFATTAKDTMKQVILSVLNGEKM